MVQKVLQSSNRKRAMFVLGALISVLCLWLTFKHLDWYTFKDEILQMSPWAILAGLILANAHNFLLAKRWHLLVRPLTPPDRIATYWNAFWSLRISFFFNASLPARLGEPFRAFYINRTSGIHAARAVGAMGADRFLDFASMCILVLISALVLGMRGSLPPTQTILTGAVALVVLFIVLAKLPKHSKWKWLNFLLQMRVRIFEGLAPLWKMNILLPTLAISFLGWIIEALIIVGFAYGLGIPISMFKAFMVLAGVTLAISIPASPGYIGTFELGAITVLSFFGVSKEQSATIAILYHMVQLIPTLLIGAYGYYFRFLNLPKNQTPSGSKYSGASNF